jgi:hypothetical protein
MTAILDDALLCIARGRRSSRWQIRQLAADADAWYAPTIRSGCFRSPAFATYSASMRITLRDRIVTTSNASARLAGGVRCAGR